MPDVNILINATNKASGPIKQVGGEIDGLSNKANSASKGGLASLAGSLGTALKVGAGLGVAAVAGVAAAVGVAGVNFGNMKQQAQIAFTTMLGDGGKAKVFLDDLQSFAAATPFEFPDLVQASQKLLAMGFAAEDVKPTLTAIGDAVAGLGGGGELIDRVTTALGQMGAKGKASAEEIGQLTEAGIPAWEILAKTLNTDVAGAMDMVSKGAVSSDVAIGALVAGMNTKFGGLMEAQSLTFGGLFSTIKDTFAQVSGQVMGPFFEKMTQGLQMIVDWTSSPQFTDGVAQLTHWLQMATDAAGVFFDDLSSGQTVLDAVSHAFRILLPPAAYLMWEKFAGVLDGVIAVIGRLWDAVAQGKNPLDALSNVWGVIVAEATTQFTRLVGYVQEQLPAWKEKLLDWASAAWEWIVDMTPVAMEKLNGWRMALVDWVTTNLPIWKEKLLGWADAAWEWIVDSVPAVMETLGDWARSIFAGLGDNLPNFIKTVLEWGTALYTWIGDAIPKAIDSLADFVRGLRDKGEVEGGNELSQMAQGWAGTLWQWIRDDVIPKVGPAFIDFIRSMLNYGSRLLASLGTLAEELGLTLWEWIVDITPVALKKLGEWGGKLWGWIKEKAPAWKDKLAEWGAIAWQWIRDIAIPEATKKLGEWGGKLWGWIKEKAPAWRTRLEEWGKAAWEWITLVAIPGAKIKLGEWGAMLVGWVELNWPKWRDSMIEAGEEMIQGLRDGIEIMWIRLTDWFFSDTAFGGFVGDILGMLDIQLGPAYGVMYKNGKRIAYSLNDGSRNGLDSLRQTGADMGSAMSSGLGANLDMNSPSRVMWGFGEDIIAGLQGGIRTGITGLKTEMQYVADQIKAGMQRANEEMLAGIEYFTNQALIKAQAAHLKIANTAIDIGGLVKQLGLDPNTTPVAWGGNLKPGQGINNLPKGNATTALPTYQGADEMLSAMNNWQKFFKSSTDPMNDYLDTIKGLIAHAPQDIQNGIDRWMKTWKSTGDPLNDFFVTVKDAVAARIENSAIGGNNNSVGGGLAGSGGNYVPLEKEITTLGQALGVIKGIVPSIAASVNLLGGLTLNQTDLDPQGTKNKSIISQAISSTFSSIKSLFAGGDIANMLANQDAPAQKAIADILERVGGIMQSVGSASSGIKDASTFQDIFYTFSKGLTNALGGGRSSAALTENNGILDWLSNLSAQASTLITQTLKTSLDAMRVKDPVADFVAGIGDFLEGTLEGANGVFRYFKALEEKAYASGTLKEFIGSAEAQTKTQLKSLYQGLQNSMAGILGITTNELNVTGVGSKRLIDRLTELTSGTNAETNMEFIGQLLQNAADFRNLSNFGTKAEYFKDVLPTDTRLTGGAQTTNNFNINLAGGASASDDLLSTFNLLNSIYGTAPA